MKPRSTASSRTRLLVLISLFALPALALDISFHAVPEQPQKDSVRVSCWDKTGDLAIDPQPSFKDEDVLRVFVLETVTVPEFTQEHVNKALACLSETQKKSFAGQITPRPAEIRNRVRIVLTNDAARRFNKYSRDHVNQKVALVIKGKIFSAAVVREPIEDGVLEVGGKFTEKELSDIFDSSDNRVFQSQP